MAEKNHPVQTGENYEIVIDDFSHAGEGIGRVNNFAIFVKGALPGERVEVKIEQVKKKFARGTIEKIITISPDRINLICPVADRCGGCQLQHLSYEKQLKMKEKRVAEILSKIGGIDVQVLPTLGMENPFYYRNKGQFHVDEINGEIALGFYENKTNNLIPTTDCWLFSAQYTKLVKYIEEKLNHLDIKIKGYLRNIVLRESKSSGEMMLIFVTRTKEWKLTKLIDKLIADFPKVVSIYQNINTSGNPVVLGKAFKLIYGKSTIHDSIGNLNFAISPQSFFQVNNLQTEILYKKALEYADLTGTETVIDAYSGIGTISLFLAPKAQKVYGIEIIAQAVEDAQKNAQLNTIENVEFIKAKAETWLTNWVKQGNKPNLVVVDPPRKGCHPDTLKAIITAQPKKIIYISCNPATLARDLKYLVDQGYQVQEVQPVDMFPMSAHVEVVTLLVRE